VYAAWEKQAAGSDKYALSNPAHLYTIQSRQRATLRRLRAEGLWPLAGQDILEVGCGTGYVLLELMSYGAEPARLHGVDLLAERAVAARQRLPHVAIACADGGRLPYPDASFDLLLQFTVFSSILDKALCYTVAKEMRRVLRPDGLILWYEFWLNPVNKHTRGIRPREVRELFPNCQCSFERITLAPPLTRRIVPHSWTGAHVLETMGIFNTHYLAAIRPYR
jgi:ubiquinone/menaquinone biosynthesis C-methylase UbiE